MLTTLIIGLSGKRKSGKDFVAARLADHIRDRLTTRLERFGYDKVYVSVVGVSYSLKEEYAELHALDASRLKFDCTYKEAVRKEMVEYGEAIRRQDPGYFCRRALESVRIDSGEDERRRSLQIVIVSDCRRQSDLAYFKQLFQFSANTSSASGANDRFCQPVFLRLEATLAVRNRRGFEFNAEIDEAETECGLDDYAEWDLRIRNDGDDRQLATDLGLLGEMVRNRVDCSG